MFDLVMKLAKKKLFKPDAETPANEYMRLELELEELCSLHALEMRDLTRMPTRSLYACLGAEEAAKVENHLARMHQLWDTLPIEKKNYLSSSDKEVTEYDNLAKDFQEKEYLMLDQELEAEAAVFYLTYRELLSMEPDKMISLLGPARAEEVEYKRSRALALWASLTPEQQDRNSFKRPNRLY